MSLVKGEEAGMKRNVMFLMLCLWAAGAAAAQMAQGGTVYVAAKTIDLKSSAGFFGETRGTLVYGSQAVVLQTNGKWAEIRSAANSSLRGWTASSNLTAKRIVSGGSGTATNTEIALAGKGFGEEVEDIYKAEGNLNYADVNKTEAAAVSERDLYSFLTDGQLSRGE
jgi:hypothetical protein